MGRRVVCVCAVFAEKCVLEHILYLSAEKCVLEHILYSIDIFHNNRQQLLMLTNKIPFHR